MVQMVDPAALALLVAVLVAHDAVTDVHGKTLEAGFRGTYVLDENGILFAWGDSDGILGEQSVYGKAIGDVASEMSSLPRLESKLANATALAKGPLCLVDTTAPPSRAVHCWGWCFFGGCGHGRPGFYLSSIADAPLTDLGSDAADRVVTVQGAYEHSLCALFSSGRIKCWGDNYHGALGLGDYKARGDEPGEMGDNLPFVDLGTDVKAAQLAVGDSACAVLEGRTRVKCWGANSFGQLGLGDTDNRGDDPGEMGDNLPAIDLGAEIEDIGVGFGFACVLLAETREVKCWGDNFWGTLGTAHKNSVTLANATLPAISVGGRVAKLGVGYGHTCVILEDAARVKCWGFNSDGQLGLGLDLGDTSGMVPSDLPDVAYGVAGETAVEISGSDQHTCVRLADGLVRCWGGNSGGQLGHGASYESWGKSPDHMGANLPTSLYQLAQQSVPSPTASPTASPSTPSASPTQAPSSSPTAPATGLAIGLGVGAAAVVALAGVAAYFRFGRSGSHDAGAVASKEKDSSLTQP